MDVDQYKRLTKKEPPKSKPRTTPLPKAKQKYIDAEERLTEQLEKLGIKFEKKFQFKSTKHWRFDFHIIGKQLLIEISGGPWSGGRGGKLAKKAWSLDRYDHAEEMGYFIKRFEPHEVFFNEAICWIRDYGTDQTISTDGPN